MAEVNVEEILRQLESDQRLQEMRAEAGSLIDDEGAARFMQWVQELRHKKPTRNMPSRRVVDEQVVWSFRPKDWSDESQPSVCFTIMVGACMTLVKRAPLEITIFQRTPQGEQSLAIRFDTDRRWRVRTHSGFVCTGRTAGTRYAGRGPDKSL